MIITFANHKGGVGKTTLALIAAQTLLDEGKSVFMFDLDQQQNFTEKMKYWFHVMDENLPVVVFNTLDNLVDKQESYTVVDTAPGLDEATKKAICVADVIVVPVVGEEDSVKGLADIIALKPKGKIIVVHNNYEKTWAYDRSSEESHKKMVEAAKDKGAKIDFVTLPRNRFIPGNFAQGEFWCVRMSEKMAQPFYQFVDFVTKSK